MPFNKWEAENFRYFLLMMPNTNCGLHLHLRLQGVSDPPLQLLVFSTPPNWRSGWGSGMWPQALGKTGGTGLQIVRYFQKTVWAQLLVSSHIYKKC